MRLSVRGIAGILPSTTRPSVPENAQKRSLTLTTPEDETSQTKEPPGGGSSAERGRDERCRPRVHGSLSPLTDVAPDERLGNPL